MWLWGAMCAAGQLPAGVFHSSSTRIRLSDLAGASVLAGQLEDFRGRTVLLAAKDQLIAALALIELDGVAQRIVLCPPDLAADHFPAVIATSGAEAWVRDAGVPEENGAGLGLAVTAHPALAPEPLLRQCTHETEWILLTSGTTGAPKLVLHTLKSLTSIIVHQLARQQPTVTPPIWSTFYDIRRYGGLQIFLRAAFRGGSLVLSDPKEPITDFLGRAAAAGITHISGTPSHWRRALMSGAAA
ncbi:MAG TPA: AMP-binding protein, partial [Steroidobacteraceae bacterium]